MTKKEMMAAMAAVVAAAALTAAVPATLHEACAHACVSVRAMLKDVERQAPPDLLYANRSVNQCPGVPATLSKNNAMAVTTTATPAVHACLRFLRMARGRSARLTWQRSQPRML